MSRLNAYKALSSPSLIALTSKDPILTAFKLSNQLKSLSKMESQFCKEYTVLREQVQVGATLTLVKNILHSVSECGFQVPKTYQAAAHIWGLPR